MPKITRNNEICFSQEAESEPQSEFKPNDSLAIDDLVLEIKENLKLKTKHPRIVKKYPAPYYVSSGYSSRQIRYDSRKSVSKSTDDPYKALQELLKDGDLIKEAVRRLQTGLAPKQCSQNYESDDELRTPPYPFTDIQV